MATRESNEVKNSSPDQFARDFLVPPEHSPALAEIGAIGDAGSMSAAIGQKARQLRICPGLLVGRLQHDTLISYRQQNHLKREADFSSVLASAAATQETWPNHPRRPAR